MTDGAIFNPQSLCNPQWIASGGYNMLFVEAYELALAPQFIPRKVFRFDDIVVAIKSAKLKYIEMSDVSVKFGERRQVNVSASHRTSISDQAAKLITVQPHASSDPDGLKALSYRSSEYISLLIATNYRNIAFRHLFTQTIGIQDDSMAMASDAFRLPFDLPKPDLSEQALNRFRSSHSHITSLEPEQQRKVRLSLRWHLKGIQSDGVESFLNFWIALETLAMDTTNISDINRMLASAYRVSPGLASKTFGVGRIYGLRCSVVHNGSRKNISANLTDYMECLYSDLLQYALLGKAQRRAEAYMLEHSLDIVALTNV